MTSGLFRYTLKRLAFVPVAVFIVVTASFALVNLVPSDPASLIGGDVASRSDLQAIRHTLGLDQSLPEQYWHYVDNLAHGNLGRSYFTQQPVSSLIWQYLPSTLELVVLSLLCAAVIGMLIGIVGAYFRDSLLDRLTSTLISAIQSIPDFLLGLALIYVLFFILRWAPPPSGQLDILDQAPPRVTGASLIDAALAGQWHIFASAARHAVLPVLTLSIFYSAFFAKTTRAVMSTALNSHQAEFARACGLPERSVIMYALRASRAPIVTYAAILFSTLIGGAAIVEVIFSWNGFGQFAVNSILKLDLPDIQGFILTAGFLTLLIFLVLDITLVLVDPRVSRE